MPCSNFTPDIFSDIIFPLILNILVEFYRPLWAKEKQKGRTNKTMLEPSLMICTAVRYDAGSDQRSQGSFFFFSSGFSPLSLGKWETGSVLHDEAFRKITRISPRCHRYTLKSATFMLKRCNFCTSDTVPLWLSAFSARGPDSEDCLFVLGGSQGASSLRHSTHICAMQRLRRTPLECSTFPFSLVLP